MSASFRPHEHLKHKRDFQRVYQEGQKIVFASCVVYFRRQDVYSERRLGISASRKVGNAVTRNRCKRLVREVFRRNKDKFPQGSDIVVVVKREMVGKRYDDLVAELMDLQQW